MFGGQSVLTLAEVFVGRTQFFCRLLAGGFPQFLAKWPLHEGAYITAAGFISAATRGQLGILGPAHSRKRITQGVNTSRQEPLGAILESCPP